MEYSPIKVLHVAVGVRRPFTVDNLLLVSPRNIDILPPAELAMHTHPFFTLGYVYDGGDSVAYVDGHKIAKRKNQVYIETPQTLHSAKNQLDGHFVTISIKFVSSDRDLIKRIGTDALCLDDAEYLRERFDEIVDYARSIAEDGAFINKLVYRLLDDVLSSPSLTPTVDKTQKPENEFVGLLKYISEHLDSELTLADLEKRAHMSHAHFSRKFKQVFNITPMNYLYSMRLFRALDELTCSTAPIEIIARKTGFKNVSSFCTAFRRAYGCSPSEYREKFIRERGFFHESK